MKRPLFAATSLLLLAGCASTGSNYYSYEGSGDYYYGAPRSNVVIDSSSYGSGLGGYAPGFGYGHAFGYGYGYGYGYGAPYSYWGYGYQPIWWVPSVPYQDPSQSRLARVERERSVRSGLVRRETVQAPESAKWLSPRSDPGSRQGFNGRQLSGHVPSQSRMRTSNSMRQTAPARSAPALPSRSTMPRAVFSPAPARSAPPPRPSSHRQ
jgi:hypothetical protein